MQRVSIVEVGPRDGFQSVGEMIPTAVKIEVINRLVGAGVQKVQATSFVNPRAIPQMQDAREVSEAVMAAHPNTAFFALVPNLRGAAGAVEAGYREVAITCSLSETHNRANINRTVAQSVEETAKILETFPDLAVVQDISMAFGCPFEGEMPLAKLLDLLDRFHALGLRDFTLCDTIGVAHPTQVQKVLAGVRAAFPEARFEVHIHDTRGMGLICSYTALLYGAAAVQTSLGGLGGCPFAPGASGNTSTEDFIYMMQREGYDTGVSFPLLLEAAKYLRQQVPGVYSGHHIDIESDNQFM